MSEFSMNVAARYLPAIEKSKLGYMYCPADTARFTPASEKQRAEARAKLFPPWMPHDAFVLGWVGRMQWRKQVWTLYNVISHLRHGTYSVCASCSRVTLDHWSTVIHSMRPMARVFAPEGPAQVCRHCGGESLQRAEPLLDVILWLHIVEEPSRDWDKQALEREFRLLRGVDIHYTSDHTIDNCAIPEQVPDFYQAWDALLYLSGGEGFGIPVWEAMASGTPVIYTNYSAHGELATCGKAGLPISGSLQPEPRARLCRMVADTGEAIKTILQMFADRNLIHRRAQNGRAFTERFSPTAQATGWHGLFQECRGSRHGLVSREIAHRSEGTLSSVPNSTTRTEAIELGLNRREGEYRL